MHKGLYSLAPFSQCSPLACILTVMRTLTPTSRLGLPASPGTSEQCIEKTRNRARGKRCRSVPTGGAGKNRCVAAAKGEVEPRVCWVLRYGPPVRYVGTRSGGPPHYKEEAQMGERPRHDA